MSDGVTGLQIPAWTLVAVPFAYHVGLTILKSLRGADEHFVTAKDHKHYESERNTRCEVCADEIAELKRIVVPRSELERIFEGIRNDLKDRKDKTHKLRNTLNKLVQRQHLMHVMVVAIGTKVGADDAIEEAVKKHRELTGTPAPIPTLEEDDEEVDPL